MKTMTAKNGDSVYCYDFRNDEISETDDEITQQNDFMKLSVCIFLIFHKIKLWTIKLTNHSYDEEIKRICTL